MPTSLKQGAAVFLLFCLLQIQTSFAQPVMDTNDVRNTYLQIAGRNKQGEANAKKCWSEVSALYSGPTRHYHTLQHLANFYNELLSCKKDLSNWDAVFLAMVYHDVVYVATNRDNEEKSAAMAADHLQQLGFSQSFIDTCRRLIMATKTHKSTDDTTTNLFIDADMSILGVPLPEYKTYVQQVYREYAAVPNFAEGRKGFLKRLLGAERLFITPHFYDRYEQSARFNIQQEIVNFQQ